MTKILECPYGGNDCGFSVAKNTEDEAIQSVAAHVKNDHGGPITPDLFTKLRDSVRDG